ncbi:MAG: phosphoribosylformylglycinamidine cyclo-ligase [Dehalococcoidia bacterium]
MTGQPDPPRAYAAAGVDVDAAGRLVSRIAELAKSTRRPEVMADVGPFAGLFRLGEYRDPVLAASTDSVGTKVKLAALLGRYEGLGHDLVNHCVNDILTTGAEPLFFLDYIGGSEVTDEAKLALVKGVADACRAAGCALLGGETADLPGLYGGGDFDLVGFVAGVVDRDAVIDGSAIREGDALLALPSNGLHTNGYSLVRKVFDIGLGGDPAAERERLEAAYPELGGASLADALLVPHRCHLDDLRPLVGAPLAAPQTSRAQRAAPLHGIAHITGGGIPGNVPRILPAGLGARIDRATWETPAIFRLIAERGDIAEEEMYRTFNMGVGIVLAVAQGDVEAVRAALPESFVVGEVIAGEGVEWA